MRVAMRWAAGVAILAGISASASAQISLNTAVDLALRNDPQVLGAQADVRKAQAAFAEAKDAYVPSASATGGYGSSTGVPLTVPQVFSLSSQSLLFNFSQKDFVRAAATSVEAAKLSLEEVREKVTEDVVVTYLSLDSAQRRQAVMSEEHGIAARLVTIVQDRLQAGQDTRIDLLKAKLRSDQIEYAELQTDDDIASLQDHLARVLGLPGNKLLAVSSSIPPLPSVDALNAQTDPQPDSFGIRAAFASATSKQEMAFGDSRYKFRPEFSFGANYSRISTTHTSYADYYPAFSNPHSDNALSVGIEIRIPLFDRAHDARARQAAADATSARFAAEEQRNTFLEGRAKLQHSLAELAASGHVASDEQDLAEEQLNATLAQLAASTNPNPNEPELTPKDEQNARLQVQIKKIDFLNAQSGLQQAEVNLMRQTGQLDGWLQGAVLSSSNLTVTPVP